MTFTLVASPAQATLAYVTGAASTHPSIWVAEDSGGAPRVLAQGSQGGDQPIVSPDGSEAIFESQPSSSDPGLSIVPSAGGPITLLSAGEANMTSTAFSPDSKTIATTLGVTPESERLVLIDIATHSVRVVATGHFEGVSFSPDSTQLAFARAANARGFPTNSDIYSTPVAGGATARLTSNHRSTQPVWGPAKIAFAHSVIVKERRERAPKGNIWVMNADGSQARPLTHQKAPFLLFGPSPLAWSASGAQLLAEFGGQDTSYGQGINPRTGAFHLFSRKRSLAFGLVAAGISRDGTTVLGATGGLEPGPGHNIVTVPFAGGPVKVIVRNAYSPSWNA
jgi:Tol biopolymer transport system component